MSRNLLLTLVLGAVAAAEAVWAFVATPPVVPPPQKLVPLGRPEELRRIHRTMKGAPELEVVQLVSPGGSHEWRLQKPLEARALNETVNPILHSLYYMDSAVRIDPEKVKTGLDDPKAVITVDVKLKEKERSFTIAVGNKEPIGDRYFYRLSEGGREIGTFLMSGYDHGAFTVPWENFEDRRILSDRPDFNALTEIEMATKYVDISKTGERSVKTEKARILMQGVGGPQLVEPADVVDEPINPDALRMLVTMLVSFQGEAKFNYVPAEKSRWGFDLPEVTVTLRFLENIVPEPLTFLFGKIEETTETGDKKEVYYAVCEQLGRVGRIEAKDFFKMPRSLSDLRLKRLFPLNWDLRRIKIADPILGRSVEVEKDPNDREGKPWKLIDPPQGKILFKPEDLAGVVDQVWVQRATVEEFLERAPTNLEQYWGKQGPSVVLTLTMARPGKEGGTFTRTIKLGKPTADNPVGYAQHDRVTQVYRVPGAYVDNIRRLWLPFMDKTHVSIDLDRMQAFKVEVLKVPGAAPFSYAAKRDAAGTGWMWEGAGPEYDLDRVKADQLVGHLVETKVKDYYSMVPAERTFYNMADNEFFIRVTVVTREDDGKPRTRVMRVANGKFHLFRKVFIMYEDDGIICEYDQPFFDLMMSGLRP